MEWFLIFLIAFISTWYGMVKEKEEQQLVKINEENLKYEKIYLNELEKPRVLIAAELIRFDNKILFAFPVAFCRLNVTKSGSIEYQVLINPLIDSHQASELLTWANQFSLEDKWSGLQKLKIPIVENYRTHSDFGVNGMRHIFWVDNIEFETVSASKIFQNKLYEIFSMPEVLVKNESNTFELKQTLWQSGYPAQIFRPFSVGLLNYENKLMEYFEIRRNYPSFNHGLPILADSNYVPASWDALTKSKRELLKELEAFGNKEKIELLLLSAINKRNKSPEKLLGRDYLYELELTKIFDREMNREHLITTTKKFTPDWIAQISNKKLLVHFRNEVSAELIVQFKDLLTNSKIISLDELIQHWKILLHLNEKLEYLEVFSGASKKEQNKFFKGYFEVINLYREPYSYFEIEFPEKTSVPNDKVFTYRVTYESTSGST